MLQEIPNPSTVLSASTDGLGTLTVQRVGGDCRVQGSLYEKTNHLTRAQIAALIRKDLKRTWETDYGTYDPNTVKVSVRTHNYAGGGSINIYIQEVDDFELRYEYREDFQLEAAVDQIAKRYHRQTSNSQEDYWANNFFLFVHLDSPVNEKVWDLPRKPKLPSPEDYESTARDKYRYVPGLVVSDTMPEWEDSSIKGTYVMAYVWVNDKEARAVKYFLEAPGIGETAWRVQDETGNDVHECESEYEARQWIANS